MLTLEAFEGEAFTDLLSASWLLAVRGHVDVCLKKGQSQVNSPQSCEISVALKLLVG